MRVLFCHNIPGKSFSVTCCFKSEEKFLRDTNLCDSVSDKAVQGRRKVWKSGRAWITVVDIICPPGWNRVNCLAKNRELKPPQPPCLRQPCAVSKGSSQNAYAFGKVEVRAKLPVVIRKIERLSPLVKVRKYRSNFCLPSNWTKNWLNKKNKNYLGTV